MFFVRKKLYLQKKYYFCGFNSNIVMTISLNTQSRASIEKITGIPYNDLLTMDVGSIDAVIEKKTGKKLKFKPVADYQLIGRGSIYLYLNRLFDFNTPKMNRYIERIK